jgi:hypothetical protein
MTAAEFRQLALSFPGVVEAAHMNHPDFRAHGRIFATLGYPDDAWGMVKLAPRQQQELMLTHPHIFVPAKGAWGLQGSTLVRLESAPLGDIQSALDLAWQLSAETPAKAARTPRGATGKRAAAKASRRSA